MVSNQCGPSSIYGSQEHTIFLGISVASFSASVGWGEQSSQLTVKLIEDDCTSVDGKVYYDSDLIKQTTYAVDDGFLGEDRWETITGSRYSGAQVDGADTLVTSAIELIGLPAYFRIGSFEMPGIIQNWTRDKSESGNPTYTVVLVDPRQLLEGTRLIIGDYSGSVSDTYNLFNVYGYMEAFGNYCPQLYYNGTAYVAGDAGDDGATFGSTAGGFGGADTNNNGMQFSRILTAINMLCNTTPRITNQWSPYGRIVFSGVNGGGGGLMGYDLLSLSDGYLSEYFLDISELPTPPSYWRVDSSEISILEFISQLCEDAGCDYYIELIPVRGMSSIMALSGIAKFIKIRTVSRVVQPSFGAIQTFIDNSAGTLDNSTGKELRDETLNAFVIGGPKQVTYQAFQHLDPELDGTDVLSQLGTTIAVGDDEIDDLILPYFGTYGNGDAIMPVKDNDGRWQFEVSTDEINEQLAILDITNFDETPDNRLTIRELELQAAAVSYDSFITTMQVLDSDLYKAIINNVGVVDGLNGIWDVSVAFELINKGMKLAARDVANPKDQMFVGKHDALGQAGKDLQRIYKWINTYATEFYGKKYQVRVPYTCAEQNSESLQIITSEEPSEGSWTDVSSVIGLTNPSTSLDFFALDDTRIGTFGRFHNASGIVVGGGTGVDARDVDFSGSFLDTSQFNPDDYGILNNKLYLRGDVEENFVYFDQSSYLSPRVVVEFADTVKKVDAGGQFPEALRLHFTLIDVAIQNVALRESAKNGIRVAQSGVGGKIADAPLLHGLQMPEAVAFGIKSNALTYGPWVSGGKPGRVRVEVDEGLVPWEYGGMTTLDLAGQSKADEGLANMKIGEMGRLTTPGYPTVSLGAEINSTPSLVENRTSITDIINETHAISGPLVAIYNYFNTTAAIGTNGPSVTDINVEVGPQGTQTSYAMSTYTQRLGRFTKGNSERLKNIGRFRLERQRQIRSLAFAKFRRFFNKSKTANRRLHAGVGLETHTPVEVFAGSINPIMSTGVGRDLRRNIISLNPITEIPNELLAYDKKAFMSLDGLIRPISMDGDGGLPQYAHAVGPTAGPNLFNQKSASAGMHPPIVNSSGVCVGGYPTWGGGPTLYNPVINIDYLNPFSNPTGVGITNRTGIMDRVGVGAGHDIDIIGRGSGVPESGLVMPVAGFDTLGGADYAEDYRALGLRGPILLQSWGYDLNGKPIPNAVDTEVDASGGIFNPTGLHDNFMDRWLKKSHTWPVAPVDLRFDRARGVWVSPPSYRFVYVKLEQTLNEDSYASGTLNPAHAGMPSRETLYDENGKIIGGNVSVPCVSDTGIIDAGPRIKVYDRAGGGGNSIASGTIVLTYYDPYFSSYYTLGGGGDSTKAEWAKLDVNLSGNTTGTASIWQGGPAVPQLTMAGPQVTVGAPPFLTGVLCAGDWVLLNRINNYWWVVGAPCTGC